jgi:hypothetical protein
MPKTPTHAAAKPEADKQFCNAQRSKQPKGVLCTRPAGWGTDHPGVGKCKRHGGSTENHRKAAAKVQAEAAVALYGLPREIAPHEALIEELYRTAGHVAWLEQIIRAGAISAAQNPTGKRRTVKLDQAVFGGGDQPSVWLDLYERERKHLKDVAKTCISLGMEERRVRIAEEQGQIFAQAVKGILTELGVIDRPEVPSVVRRHLTLVAGQAA